MHKRTIEGYVLHQYYQGLEKAAHVAFVLLLAYTGWIFYVAFTATKSNVVYGCFGTLLLALAIWFVVGNRRTHDIVFARFSVGMDTVSNTMGGKVSTIQSDEAVFCTRASIEIAGGKSIRVEEFFIIASQSNQALRECDKSGLKPIEKLINAGAVVLPVREEVTNWITERFGVETIAEYPKVMYFPVKQADEWEYTEW